MSQRVEVVSNLHVRKNLPEGSTQGLSAQYFRPILQVIYHLTLPAGGLRLRVMLASSPRLALPLG